MSLSRVARLWFGLTALVIAVGVVVQLFVSHNKTDGFFSEPWERVFNVFVFFTIQSNVIAAIGCAVLAMGRAQPTLFFRAVRLLGTLGILLTFIVFQLVLRQLQDLTGGAAFADVLLHTVAPIMCVAGWLVFGPRGWVDRAAIVLTVIYLVLWGAFTMIRGEIAGFYPYPFTDPTDNGYLRVALNLVLVGLVFVFLGVGAMWLDRRLESRRITEAHVEPAAASEVAR